MVYMLGELLGLSPVDYNGFIELHDWKINELIDEWRDVMKSHT